ncbi:hypothetical protein AB0J21_31075 [Streptomyces sp. NPDC049954]|uniref:hypothetical protein n=1 Tax=Streptomyces sp. NPDC049954 TaxID=3155779 RepID=UPI00342C79E0
MWPGQQPPGGEQNPQDPNQQPSPYQQPGYPQANPNQPGSPQPGPNPYQQPGSPQPNPYGQHSGYGQPNPYQQQPGGGWSAPTTPQGPGVPPPGRGRNTTRTVAIVSALAVVVAAGVTAFVVLGGDDGKNEAKGDDKKPAPSASTPSASESPSPSGGSDRGGPGMEPTIPGWQVVVNPTYGTVFEVPGDWEVETSDTSIGFEWKDKSKPDGTDSTTVNRPALFKSKWCTTDEDKDGTLDDTSLALTGTRGEEGAKSADAAAEARVPWWVYGGYTEPDRKSVKHEKAKPYTTRSGLTGSVAVAHSENTPQTGKCTSDGKAITFAFKNGGGDYVSWNLAAAKGVKDEVPEETVQRILSTVRLTDEPPTG